MAGINTGGHTHSIAYLRIRTSGYYGLPVVAQSGGRYYSLGKGITVVTMPASTVLVLATYPPASGSGLLPV